MNVQLRLFAGLRQAAGFKDKTVELPEDATVANLLDQLPAAITGRTYYIAVNQTYAGRDAILKDGDEVALLPPVSGGNTRKTDRKTL